LINGLTIGSFYGLIALGYSMVYGVLKLINFAHGDFFALGSYLGYTLLVFRAGFVTTHLGLWGGLAVTMVVAALCLAPVGVVVERVAYRPIYPAGRLPAVVSALGVSIILQNLIMIIGGPRYQAYPAELMPNFHVHAAGLNLTGLRLLIFCVSFALMAVLSLVIQKTTWRAAVRVPALDRDAAALMDPGGLSGGSGLSAR
jgi:branched-chain amino acid transport system permease protein